ncbi:MAG TPA: DMT family transporter [Candidatus Limnocylindrales bacterium]|nr:DMT family transporter [Candidatus Limnocylindrales bacterium]
MTSPLRARLLLIAAAVLFSTGGAAIKAPALTGWQIAAFRSGIATVFLLAAIPETRRGWSLRMLPVAACYAATLVSFVLANRLTTAANTIFLQSTAPLYVLLLGPFVLHEPIRRRDLAFVAAVCAGIACFFAGSAPAAVTAPDPHRGNLIALLSGLFYALMLTGLRFLARGSAHQSATATVALGNLLACLAALPMALPTAAISTRDFSALLYLGIVQIGIAYLCLVRGMRHVRAVEASALLMVEPALNPIWTWLVHGETPAVWSIAGGLLILGASFYNAASKT